MSLFRIGLNEKGFHPFTCKKLYDTIVLSGGLFGCEILFSLKSSELLQLERCHRFCLKRIQGIDKFARTDIVLGMLQILNMECIIDKRKLNLFGQLCILNPNNIIKVIFIKRLCSFCLSNCTQAGYFSDIFFILKKYGLTNYLFSYYNDGIYPKRLKWKSTIKQTVNAFFTEHWLYRVNSDPDLYLFAKIHPAFCESIFWHISKCKYKYKRHCRNIIKIISALGSYNANKLCSKCGSFYNNEALHCLIHCISVQEIRSKAMDALFYTYGIEVYNYFYSSSDDIKLCILLGGPIPEFTELLHVCHIDFIILMVYYIDRMWSIFHG